MTGRKRTRRLRGGEPIPSHPAMRYLTTDGYVVLRWQVGKNSYVEVLEHRVVAGVVSEMHVHHVNHDKTDNRPENLMVVDVREHATHHGSETAKIDFKEAATLYQSGWLLSDLADRYGCHHVSVLRALRRRGVPIRSSWESRKRGFQRVEPLPEDAA